jgi:hypothetical protein
VSTAHGLVFLQSSCQLAGLNLTLPTFPIMYFYYFTVFSSVIAT